MSDGAAQRPRPTWSVALLSMLHSAQIATVEAFVFIDRPLSALLVYEALSRSSSFETVAYHVRRLAHTGVLEELYSEPRRGAIEHFYGLAR